MISDTLRQLHEASGLTFGRIASIFGVSRQAFHKWMRGKPCTETHKEHILEVSVLIQEVHYRLGHEEEVSKWLLTPTSPGGKKPIDYLIERQYAVLRGFLLHRRTDRREQCTALYPSGRIFQERPREEVEEVLERLRPGSCLEDYDDEPYWAGGISIPDEVLQGVIHKGEVP